MLAEKAAWKDSSASHPAVVRLRGRRVRPTGEEEVLETSPVPNETAIEIRANEEAIAVMMATPADLEDFAVGFLMTEGFAAEVSAVSNLRIEDRPQGLVLAAKLASKPDTRRERGLEGRSGCGLCGIRTLDEAMRCVPAVTARPPVESAAIHRALDALPALQILNRSTRAVHAAAWSDRDGNVIALREDVGRHNALDKLLGWLARTGMDPLSGFVVITSRCSYEMVQKSAVMNIGTLVAISAPTALAVAVAREAGMTLAAVARADSHILFTG